MNKYSDIPELNIPLEKKTVPVRSENEMKKVIERILKIAIDGKKIREEYLSRNLGNAST